MKSGINGNSYYSAAMELFFSSLKKVKIRRDIFKTRRAGSKGIPEKYKAVCRKAFDCSYP